MQSRVVFIQMALLLPRLAMTALRDCGISSVASALQCSRGITIQCMRVHSVQMAQCSLPARKMRRSRFSLHGQVGSVVVYIADSNLECVENLTEPRVGRAPADCEGVWKRSRSGSQAHIHTNVLNSAVVLCQCRAVLLRVRGF